MQLDWSWQCVPYIVCALSLVVVAAVAALVRGDRVLRLGTISAVIATLPWATCSAVATCTDDPAFATRLLRIGNGPIALIGPSLLLILVAVAGQLERHRWTVRIAGIVGAVLFVLCWGTDWVVAGVHRIPAGSFYLDPGPLTPYYFTQIGVWLAIGTVIARRSRSRPERRRMVWMLIGVLSLGTISATDLLLVYKIAGVFPMAWLCATIAALVTVYYELATDLLRPQGFDRDLFVELVAFAIAITIIAVLALTLGDAHPVAIATLGSGIWVAALGVAWAMSRDQPVRIARERALEEFVATVGDIDSDTKIGQQLAALWKEVRIDVRSLSRLEGDHLIDIATAAARALDEQVIAWLVDHGDLFDEVELGTMKLGPIRPKLEQLVAGGSTLIVPLVDRGKLVGLVEAEHGVALREDERGLVRESVRAAARALTYVALSRAASLEHQTAREVEVAEAMRLQAAASRDDELGRWAVAAEYRSAARTTGAGWSASLLADGRIAVLVTEAHARGVAGALATAALTGAFTAATSSSDRIGLDELVTSLRANVEGVIRGGERVAAFLAIIDADAHEIAWASAGHAGALVIGSVAANVEAQGSDSGPPPEMVVLGGAGTRDASSTTVALRGAARFADDAMLVIASRGLHGDDEARFHALARGQAAAGARLASMLVAGAARTGQPDDDLLAVVVRQRTTRRTPNPMK